MSEPRRWKDSADAPIGMRELLGSAKPPRSLDERTFRSGQSRVAKMSVAPAAVAVVGIWTKLAAAGAIGLAATAAVVVEARREPVAVVAPAAPRAPRAVAVATGAVVAAPLVAAPEEPAAAPAPAAVPTSAPKLAARPRPLVVTADPVAPAPVWIPEERARPTNTLSAELGLLEEARRAMTTNPASALERLAVHRTRYPAGALAVERDLIELDALRRTGHVQDARERATAWLAREPNGIHAGRLRALLSSL